MNELVFLTERRMSILWNEGWLKMSSFEVRRNSDVPILFIEFCKGCVYVHVRTRSMLWENKFQSFLLQHLPPSSQACCFHFFLFPPSWCGVCPSPIQRYSARSILCMEKLTGKNFYQWAALHWLRSATGGPWRQTEGTPLTVPLQSHLGPVMSLSKGQACVTAALCVWQFSPRGSGSVPNSPFSGPGPVSPVLTLSQGAALTPVVSSQLSKGTLY